MGIIIPHLELKCTVNFISNNEISSLYPMGIKIRIVTVTTSIQHCTGQLNQCKKKKVIKVGKEEIKLLFADHNYVHKTFKVTHQILKITMSTTTGYEAQAQE